MLPLQDLDRLPDRFDALLCVDALEYVAPEDWPAVAAAGLRITADADADYYWHLLLTHENHVSCGRSIFHYGTAVVPRSGDSSQPPRL